MVDPVTLRTWSYRSVLVGLVAALAVVRLLPLGSGMNGIPGPDLIVILVFAWVVRRPSYAPAWLIVGLFLPLDLLFQRPPGLGALAVLLGAEFLRTRVETIRTAPFPLEWAMVTAVLLAIVAGTQAVMGLFFVPRPPLGLDILRALTTAAVYPLVVLVTAFVFNLRKASQGEVDALGSRL